MIIGLSGPQRAGKTTVSRILVEDHGATFMSVGQQIKDYSHKLIGTSFSEDEKDTPQEILGGKTPRDLYIHIGQTDEFIGELWVNQMFENQYGCDDELHVIESVGKPIQWKAVKKFAAEGPTSCVMFDVVRPGHEYKDNRRGVEDPNWTLIIHNEYDINELKWQVNNLLEFVKKYEDNFIPKIGG